MAHQVVGAGREGFEVPTTTVACVNFGRPITTLEILMTGTLICCDVAVWSRRVVLPSAAICGHLRPPVVTMRCVSRALGPVATEDFALDRPVRKPGNRLCPCGLVARRARHRISCA